MSIFKTPIAVIKEIEAIRNQLFLGADTDENKMTWIKWNKVMASKKDGGLGIGSLYGFNRVLLFKWKWRFMDPESVVANRLNLAPNAPFLLRNPRGGAEKDQWVALLSLLETHVSSNQRNRWLKEMPTKVNIFIWRMLLNKLPTRMNLMNRGINVQSNQCGICDTGDETINHLMLHCDLARDVWALVGRWWTLDFPSVLSIRELMSWVDDTC
ncbi:RNA-directed DNA polymerase, eukaryota [Tanacetum coccineum]